MSLEDHLIRLERFCSKAWREHAHEDPFSRLSFNEYDYIRTIGEKKSEGIRVTDLANEMLVTKPSASNMVSKLERKNLVKRITCSEDARSKLIVLTDEAINGMSRESEIYQHIANTLNHHLSEAESAQLANLLGKAMK